MVSSNSSGTEMRLWCVCVAVVLACTYSVSLGCNEAVCASVVSKCMLLQACRCNLRENCSCCKECWNCLGSMYSDCCSCVGMCPKPNDTYTGLGQKSHVERLEPFDELFRVLTNEADPQERWSAYEYPILFLREEDNTDAYPNAPVTVTSITTSPSGAVPPSGTADPNGEVINPHKVLEMKCRVAYMSQCMSWNKCKESCNSMGAESYRWFHDGCCECVGFTCVNYGIDESRCSQCPLSEEEDIGSESDDGSDYVYEDEDEDANEEGEDQPGSEEGEDQPGSEEEGKDDSKSEGENVQEEGNVQDIESDAADGKESPDNPIDENG